MPPRILVLSASAGLGHLRAAEAVELALREVRPDAVVRNLDVLTLSNALFRWCYSKVYLQIVHRAPHVYGYFYELLDHIDRPATSPTFGDHLRRSLQALNLRRLLRLLGGEPWDLAISTHFLATEVLAGQRRRNRLRLPHVTVVTDFEPHRIWVHQPCDHYYVATEPGRHYLHHLGVPLGDVTVTGIPVHPVFAVPQDRAGLLAKHRLAGDRPVVLHLGGAHGIGPVERLHKALLEVPIPLDVVAVAGHNRCLKARLEALQGDGGGTPPRAPSRHRVRVLGFTTEIHELMTVADLVVSKPGGLTTSEALASGAVLVVVNPVPGQETRNSDYLLEHGAAIKVNHPATLAYKVTQLLEDRGRLARLQANARGLGRPRAAFAVVEHALRFLKKSNGAG